MDEAGIVDVYVVELRDEAQRTGRIQRIDGATGNITVVGEITIKEGG